MAHIGLYNNADNRFGPQLGVWYISEDAGTVTDPTVVGLTEVFSTKLDNFTEVVSYVSATKKITLAAGYLYKVTVQTEQTGASAKTDIYNLTGTAVVRATPAAAGAKNLVTFIRTTTAARDIQIRVDDQTANGSTEATGVVAVEVLGKVIG